MSSSIPGAVTALISIATAALPDTAQVWFGTPLGAYSAPVTLEILKVTGTQEWAVLGPEYRREEDYAIQCQLSSFAGDPDHAARMAEVFSNFALLTVAIGNNPTLNGAVRIATVSDFDYEPTTDAKGMTCGSLSFSVLCEQRVTSLS